MARLITCEALKVMMDRQETYALFDVQEQGEYHAGQIWLATSLPRREIEFRLPDLVPVRQTPVIVYDEGGERAKLAATTMARMGYAEARVLQGGLAAWESAGYPAVTGVNVPSKEFGERVHVQRRVPEITPEELQARREGGERLLVLDTRTPEEYRRGCIPGGLNVPGGDLILWADDLRRDPGTTVIVNCGGAPEASSGPRPSAASAFPTSARSVTGPWAGSWPGSIWSAGPRARPLLHQLRAARPRRPSLSKWRRKREFR